MLPIVLGFAVGQPGLAAENGRCERCDLTYLRCRSAVRVTLEDCRSQLGLDCRTKCDVISNDDQGTRDPTRFNFCVRNCSKEDDCDQAFSRGYNRCGGARALCRQRATCT